MFSKGISNITIEDIENKISEFDILSYYLNITNIPCLINSPLRSDNNPSFGIYSNDGYTVRFRDFSTKESGDIYDLLSRLWNLDFPSTLDKIYSDITKINPNKDIVKISVTRNIDYKKSPSELKCKIRNWESHDIMYWDSYGIELKWLRYADVYPVSHIIIEKEGKEHIFPADKYAYAYVERKEGKITLKIYQPFNKKHKWSNKHDKSVISLWTKIPDKGDILCICSSLKDALCLSSNTNISAIAVQGEGYSMSKTAIDNLKSRFKNIYVIFDNDEPGLIDSAKFSLETGFTNIILPKLSEYDNPKDISDIYYAMKDKNKFKNLINNLLTLKY